MTTPTSFVIGPINSGTSFLIVRTTTSSGSTGPVPEVLNVTEQGSRFRYYWESDINKVTSKLPVFTAVGADNLFTVNDTTNSGSLSFFDDTSGQLILNRTLQGQPLHFFQSSAATWNPPTQFLANLKYSILDPTTNKTLVIYSSEQGTSDETTPANDIMMLPTFWFTLCSNGKYDKFTTPICSLSEWFCMIIGDTQCSCPDIPNHATSPNGYSLYRDCVNNYQYNYCPLSQTCGSYNCNGPCSLIYEDCLAGSNNSFNCKFDAEKYLTETDWWKSLWFIITITVIFVLILVLVIFAIVTASKAKKKKIKAEKDPEIKLSGKPDLEWE